MKLVAVDLGNTRAHMGTFEVSDRRALKFRSMVPVSHAVSGSVALYVDSKLSQRTYVYASVNPWAESRFVHAVLKATGEVPLRLGRDFPALVRNRYRNPEEVGLDRLANASAAWARLKRACIVVDLGTAITFEVVNGRGDFVGGMIAPGLHTQSKALHQQTALLPQVTPRRVRKPVATDTVSAITAGVSYGVEGLIRSGLAAIRKTLGRGAPALGTGGDAALFRDLVDEVVPELTVEGIAVSYVRSR